MAYGQSFTILAHVLAHMEVQGHRGARAVLPENTLPAFEHAVTAGADTLELDVVVTKDDQVVVTHDPLVNPNLCLGPSGERITTEVPIRTLTLAEVKRFDCGSIPNPRFPRQKTIPKTSMPSLDEVCALASRTKVRLNVETKIVPGQPDLTPAPERFAELVAGVLRKHGLIGRTTIQSFDRRTLIAAKKIDPAITIAQLTGENMPDLVAAAKAIGAEIVSPNHEWITKDEVARLHAEKIRVIPWTANDERAWARLVDFGVDGIITDDPAALIAFLEARRAR